MKFRTARKAGFLLLSALGLSAAESAVPYTVDHMLAVEEIGKVRFTPGGSRLLFEHYGSFEAQSNFGRPVIHGELRSRILAVDLDVDAPPSLLFEQSPDTGYTMLGLSPDGTRLLFSRASAAGMGVGIAPVAGGRPAMFDISPDYSRFLEPPWLDRNRLVLEALRPGDVAAAAGLELEWVDNLTAQWRQRNVGRVPTASRIGSGRLASFPDSEGSLVLADADRMETIPLARGDFTAWYASPDGRLIAALREQRLAVDPDNLIEHGANIGGIERRLVILDAARSRSAEACSGCDVLLFSVNWSASSSLLAFAARDAGSEWRDAAFRIYDPRTGRSRTIDLGNLKPGRGRANGARFDMRSAWIGDRLVVLAEAPPVAGQSRADWYLVGEGVPRNLTGTFAGRPPELIGVHGHSLIVLHNGDAWRIHADGRRDNLTAAIAEPVSAWREPSPFAPPTPDLRSAATVTLVAAGGSGAPDSLLFVEIATGTIATLTAPSIGSTFVAVSPEARRAAVAERHDNVTTLTVIGTDGSRRAVTTINAHLQGVAGGTPVRIDHRGPTGDARTSWLLLPPGHRPGARLPTVVSIYPGTVGRSTYSGWRLDQIHPLNGHILAAQGYAVLYASLPVDYSAVPRDPLQGLEREVFAAVDAAVAQGYVDPERLAIQGHSYGGYSAGGLVGLTNRFRSAVALSGVYDLISYYGQFDIRYRLYQERHGLNMFAVSHAESSQGGMGAAPWVDPQRYLRNSPLMHVAAIETPIMLMSGDRDYVSTTQTEEFFTALTRLNKDAEFVRYHGEGHVFNSPANIRDMWARLIAWYRETLLPAPSARTVPDR